VKAKREAGMKNRPAFPPARFVIKRPLNSFVRPNCGVGCALLIAVFAGGCSHSRTGPVAAGAVANESVPLTLSSRIVGRVIAVDAARGFAFVDVRHQAPAAATTAGAMLSSRKLDLTETARLRASSYLHGRTLGTEIVSGQPTPGDEVVWQTAR
jgi:hypothetical protein